MKEANLIGVDSLEELLGSGGPAMGTGIVLLDCRFDLAAPEAGRRAYLAGHIPGARYADLDRDLAGPVAAHTGRHPLPSPEALAARLAAFGIANDTPVIAYDEANGAFAARAWWLLRWLGARQVAVLDGGFNAWVAGGRALESGAAGENARLGEPVRFTPAADHRSVATSADVLGAIRDTARLVVDARAPERYAGTVEPIDPVAGHVPGAVNHPFAGNLGSDGRFLPAAELRRRWQERLGDTAPKNVIVMCGSGVTACHDLLAMELAGLSGARLYAGSWSEWIRNPENPVARGSAP